MKSDFQKTLHMRAMRDVARAGRRGFIVDIGCETRSQQELVEEGLLVQEIFDGLRYKFTLSASGRKMLDAADSS